MGSTNLSQINTLVRPTSVQPRQEVRDSQQVGGPKAVETSRDVKEGLVRGNNQKIPPAAAAPGASSALPAPREAPEGTVHIDPDLIDVRGAAEIREAKFELLTLERKLVDRNTSPDAFKESLSLLVAMRTPIALRDDQDRIVAAAINRFAGSAMLFATKGMDVFSGPGLRVAAEATEAHVRLVEGMAALRSGSDASAVRAAMNEISNALQLMISGDGKEKKSLQAVVRDGDKKKLQAVADCLRLIGDSRAAGLEALAENRESVETAIAGMTPDSAQGGDPVGSMRKAADCLRNVADAAADSPAMARLPEADRLAGDFIDAAEALSLALAESRLQDNPLVLDQLRDFIGIAKAGTDAVERLCGPDESLPLAWNGDWAKLVLSEKKTDIETMTAYMGKLDAFMNGLTPERCDAIPEALNAVASPPDLDVPAAMRKEMEKKAEALDKRIQELRDGFEKEQAPRITELLSRDLDAAMEEIAKILEQPLVSDEMRARVADEVVDALRAGNEKALEDVKNLETEISEFAKTYSEVRTSKERDAVAAEFDGLTQKINGQLAKLKKANDDEKAKLAEGGARKTVAGDQAGRVSALLDEIAAEIVKTRDEALVNARTSLTLLRFTNTIANKLSPDVVFYKGLPGLGAILGKFTLGETERSALLGKLETNPGELTGDERTLLHRQLSNAMTTRQKGDDPIKTALDRLLVSGGELRDSDLEALRRSSVFILSREEAKVLKEQVETASTNNLTAMNGMLTALEKRCAPPKPGPKGAAPELGPTETALFNFGTDAENLLLEAKSVLLRADFKTFETSVEELRKKLLPEMASMCIARANAGELTTGDKEALPDLLERTGCDIEFCILALGAGNVEVFLDSEQGEAAIEKLALSRPDLDETCLFLKTRNIRHGHANFRGTPEEKKAAKEQWKKQWEEQRPERQRQVQQMALRHESNRLVRACQSMLPKKIAQKLGNMTPDEFIKAFRNNADLGSSCDLFVIQAAWLSHCAALENPNPNDIDEFNAFRNKLPGKYKNMENLHAQLHHGLLSTAHADELGKFLDSESSRFNRSGIRHRLLNLLGFATGSILTDSDSVDKMLADLNAPPGYAAADRIAKRILFNALGVKSGVSVTVDANSLKMMVTRTIGKNARNNIASQINTAGIRGGKLSSPDNSKELAAVEEERKALATRHEPALEAMYTEMNHKNGKEMSQNVNRVLFTNGSGLAMDVLAIHAIIGDGDDGMGESAGNWEARQGWLKQDIEPQKMAKNARKINLLSMSVNSMRRSDQAKTVAAKFFETLERLKNAQTAGEFEHHKKIMLGIINDNNLVGRAEAALAFKTAKLSDMAKKRTLVMDPNVGFAMKIKGMNEKVQSHLRDKYGDLYQAEATLRKERSDLGKSALEPKEILDPPVVDAMRKMADVVLLNAFTSGGASASFGDFVEAFSPDSKGSGYAEAVGMMTDAIMRMHKGIKEPNAKQVAELFLNRAVRRYKSAKGGAQARLERQDAGNKVYGNTKKIKSPADRDAILNALRNVHLEDTVKNLERNSVLQLDTKLGLSVSADVDPVGFSMSLAIVHGIALERDNAGKLNLYLSRGVAASLGASVGAFADMVSADAGVSGSAAGGYRLEFENDAQCVRFMGAMFGGGTDSLDGLYGKASKVEQSSIRFTAELKASIAGLVEKGAPVVDAVQYGVLEALRGDVDDRDIVQAEARVDVSGGLETRTERRGGDMHAAYTVTGSASAVVKAAAGRNEEYGAEASGSASFAATLDAQYRDGKLVGAAMTRTFEFSVDANAIFIAATLRNFGIDNEHAAQYIQDCIAAGEKVVLHIDAKLSDAGLKKCREAKGDMARLWALRDRSNYDNSLVRVETTSNETAYEHRTEIEPKDNPAGIGTVAVSGNFDGSVTRMREFRASPAA